MSSYNNSVATTQILIDLFKRFRPGFLSMLLPFFLIGCYSAPKKVIKTEIQNFDVTPDGKHVIFSWNNYGKMSLFKADIDGKNAKLLFEQERNRLLLSDPRCSTDGKRIVFLGLMPSTYETSIWTVDASGDHLHLEKKANSLIMEALFSNVGDQIYYTMAKTYKAYSPIARKAPHEYDIYSLSLGDLKTNQITSLNSYSISDLIDFDSTRLVFTFVDHGKGIYSCQKDGSDLKRITISKDTSNDVNECSRPTLIDAEHIIVTRFNQLVAIDMKLKHDRVILQLNGPQFRTIRYNKKLGVIFFTSTEHTNIIYSVNLDGTDLRTINIDFN